MNQKDPYRELQKHLDQMPVGLPSTASGVELRLLKFLFTPEQAQIALALDHKLRSVEQIRERLQGPKMSVEALKTKLEEMVDAGTTYCKKQESGNTYANMPLVVGMLELQTKRMTEEFLRDTKEYFEEKYAAAYLGTGVSQTRVIPIEKSVSVEHRIGTYDELKALIEKAGGRIRIGECICRSSKDMGGKPCAVTSRTETCMAFREFADLLARMDWGRSISAKEALEIAEKSEEEGLVLQPANEQEPQFICSCCGDCCGILGMLKAVPKPAEAVACNFYAKTAPLLCVACGTCLDRCQMEAITLEGDFALIDRDRCIGCGLCVSTCAAGSIRLVKKKNEVVPPKDFEALYQAILDRKGLGASGAD